jgi:hypothetical protein
MQQGIDGYCRPEAPAFLQGGQHSVCFAALALTCTMYQYNPVLYGGATATPAFAAVPFLYLCISARLPSICQQQTNVHCVRLRLCSCALARVHCAILSGATAGLTWIFLSVEGMKGATAHQLLQGATAHIWFARVRLPISGLQGCDCPHLVSKGATAQSSLKS